MSDLILLTIGDQEPDRCPSLDDAKAKAAAAGETGRDPALTTGGGTSDARYIKDVCPVAELGVRNEMAHKVDECIPVDEIETLCRIYYRLLASYFAAA